MDEEETPSYFLCPISLQTMKDPVTLATGVTYDRSSIERWLSEDGHNTCPVTNQPLPDRTLTPNSTLLRLIHTWAAGKAPSKTPTKPIVDVAASIADLVKELAQPNRHIKTIGKIKSLIQDNVENEQLKVCMEESGVTSFVASVATRRRWQETSASFSNSSAMINEATSLLRLMSPSPATMKKLAELKDGELIRSLSSTMQKGCCRARLDAAVLLKCIFRVVDDKFKAAPPGDLFEGLIDVLKDQNSDGATTKTALSILLEVVQHGRNRVKAVESGAVAVMVELLLEETGDRRRCEECVVWEGRGPGGFDGAPGWGGGDSREDVEGVAYCNGEGCEGIAAAVQILWWWSGGGDDGGGCCCKTLHGCAGGVQQER